MNKDVVIAISVAANEVAGKRIEGNKTAVAADAGSIAVIIPRVVTAVDRDAVSLSRLAVVDKDMDYVIASAINEGAGKGIKGDITTVAANTEGIAEAAEMVPLIAVAVHRDAFNVAGGSAG